MNHKSYIIHNIGGIPGPLTVENEWLLFHWHRGWGIPPNHTQKKNHQSCIMELMAFIFHEKPSMIKFLPPTGHQSWSFFELWGWISYGIESIGYLNESWWKPWFTNNWWLSLSFNKICAGSSSLGTELFFKFGSCWQQDLSSRPYEKV